MIIIAGLVIGAIFGAMRARALKGNRKDMAQYAAGFGIAFGIVAMFLTIFIDRML